MKRGLVWVLVLGLLSGCGKDALLPYAREMDDVALVQTVGVDAQEAGVRLCAAADGRSGEELTLSAQGDSIPAAAQAVQSRGERYISFGHVEHLLVGEAQAERGLAELMDYLAREPQLGPGAQLWVVYGDAAQAVETSGVTRRLAQLGTDGAPGTAKIGCSAARLMSVMARGGSAYLPALNLVPLQEGEKPLLVSDGYAIVRQGKLVCQTDPETTLGLELMEGVGSMAELRLADGTRVTLEMKRVRTRCRPVFSDGALTGVDVTCHLNARVVQTGRSLRKDDLKRLQYGLERLQGERIVRALELGQYWDADFLDLMRRTQLACPSRKEDIQEQWDQVFRAMSLRVEVRGELDDPGGAERRS